jgi:hypothetical protein
MSATRELLYYWDLGGLNVLVPKRRGVGFLRCPLGHHYVEFYASLETELHCDICGLDGALYFEFHPRLNTAHPRSVLEAMTQRVMAKLGAHHIATFREVGVDEFHRQLPHNRK